MEILRPRAVLTAALGVEMGIAVLVGELRQLYGD
jgi:hypothetical protein